MSSSGNDAVLIGNLSPMFRRSLLPPSSRQLNRHALLFCTDHTVHLLKTNLMVTS